MNRGVITYPHGLPDNIARTGTAVQIEFNQSQSEVVHLFSSSDSQVIFRYGSPTSEGLTYLPSTSGSYFGQQFIPPQTNSTLRLANPGKTSLTVAWRGGGITVAAQDFEEVSWPPSTTYSNPLILESDTPFSLLWSSYDASNSVDTRSGMVQLIAEDTGFWTGSHFNYTSSTDSNQNLEVSLRGYRSQFQWQQVLRVVEEVATCIMGSLHALERRVVGHLGVERDPGPERKHTDLQSTGAKSPVFHVVCRDRHDEEPTGWQVVVMDAP